MMARFLDLQELQKLAATSAANEFEAVLYTNQKIASDHSLLKIAIDADNQQNAITLLNFLDNSSNNHRSKSELYIKAVVKQLHLLVVEFNSKFSISNDIQLRAFRTAISNSDLWMVKVLLEQSSLSTYDPKLLPIEGLGETGSAELIRYLIKKGVDLNFGNGQPLLGAVLAGKTNAIRELVEFGADLYIADNLAFKHAALGQTDECLGLLLELADSVDRNGEVFDTKLWTTSVACRETILSYQLANSLNQFKYDPEPLKINLEGLLRIPNPKIDYEP